MSKEAANKILQDILEVNKELRRLPTRHEYFKIYGNFSIEQVRNEFGSWLALYNAAGSQDEPEEKRDPKILVFDIETLPIEALVWDVWDQNVGFNQVTQDWTIASVAAKWLDKPEIFYLDVRKQKNLRDDRKVLKMILDLLNQADIIVTKNGIKFDSKKLNARFQIWEMGIPGPAKHADVQRIVSKNLGFTFKSLEAICVYLKCKYQKLKHEKFLGMELWKECLKRNPEAWDEMEKYNKRDVLATEECFKKLRGWGVPGLDINVFQGAAVFACKHCGSSSLMENGKSFQSTGIFRRYKCRDCGGNTTEKGKARNMISTKKKDSLNGL